MLPADLQKRTSEVADQLDRATGFWSRNIAARLRSVADYAGGTPAEFIKRNVSLADYNHIQSRVNFLTAQVQSWSEANEDYAPQIAQDFRQQLAEARNQQSMIIELIQFAWLAG
jgi:hypothetical protein